MVVRITCYQYSRLTSALLIVILRPLYSIGIGIGILGMSEKIGGNTSINVEHLIYHFIISGYAQSVCEWRPAIFMGNFTYSTYVVHYVYVFYRTATTTKPLDVSDGILVSNYFTIIVLFTTTNNKTILASIIFNRLHNVIFPRISDAHFN